jgi:eukaryotic-like serine/threonine-protein kinase
VIAGRYRLLRPLARGGMAEIWQAHDQTLDRDVAIKVLHAHLATDPDFVERFRREALAVARLSHPNVVTVYDTGVEGSTGGTQRAYIVMELLRGSSLRALLNDPDPAGRPTLVESVRITAEAADGLAYAHRSGVIHRDVKPGNIFVETASKESGRGRFGRVRVVDFGIAKQAAGDLSGEDLTQIGSILGTAKYVAPEQVEGHLVDARSDIYSLAIVLYEMICGRVPFQGANDLQTAMLHVRAELPRPRSVRAGVPRSLESVVLRALQKDPAKRFSSADEFANALRSVDLRADDAVPAVRRNPSDHTPHGVSTRPARPIKPIKPGEATGQDPTTVRQGVPVAPPTDGVRVRGQKASSEPLERPRRRSLWLLLPIVGLLSGALLGVTLADGRSERVERLTVLQPQSFELDPDGEHDLELPRLLDGNPTTTWSTETYGSRSFNGRKSGVGVVLILPDATEVRSLDIDTPSQGWSGKVYVRDELPSDLDGWGNPVGQVVSSRTGHSRIDLRASRGRYVMLWITDLGPKATQFAQVKIGELSVWG